MSSRIYLVLSAAAAAGVLFSLGIVFGLGLLAPPAKIEAGGSSPYLARTRGATEQVTRMDDRALTPIYPTSPSGAPADETPAAPPAVKAETTGAATPLQSPAATPAPTQSANTCDVAACAAAYRSFRQSDCTYQPFEGPRQFCASPPTPDRGQASTPRDRNGLYPPPSMRDGRRVIVIERW